MPFIFRKNHVKSAEQRGWILIPDKSADILSQSVRTIVDAGTGNGERLAYFLHTFPNAIIHCFEPGLIAFAKLEKCYRKHRRIILNRMALCGSSGLSRQGEITGPCQRPLPIAERSELISSDDYLVKVTLDDYCRVC